MTTCALLFRVLQHGVELRPQESNGRGVSKPATLHHAVLRFNHVVVDEGRAPQLLGLPRWCDG